MRSQSSLKIRLLIKFLVFRGLHAVLVFRVFPILWINYAINFLSTNRPFIITDSFSLSLFSKVFLPCCTLGGASKRFPIKY